MSRMPIIGIVSAAGLVALAILPQVSTAAVQGNHRAPPVVATDTAGQGTDAVASASEGYKTCFMKRSIVYTGGAPKAVTTRQCVQ
ncbi:hypothetical protein [Ancylobacter terrae]|uniref:hypothetical protein n=1 Tax=Ancylobacter sp. sgz301288 TaxID=3342077 RepID=UPI00385E49A1